MAEQTTGKIVRLIADKGFGFIHVDGADDVFFHARECRSPFVEYQIGVEVRFEKVETEKGIQGKSVQLVWITEGISR